MKINSNNVPWSILYKTAFLDRIEKNSKAPFPQNQLVSLRNRTGEEEDGKPCVTGVTIILYEKTFRQASPSFKQILL